MVAITNNNNLDDNNSHSCQLPPTACRKQWQRSALDSFLWRSRIAREQRVLTHNTGSGGGYKRYLKLPQIHSAELSKRGPPYQAQGTRHPTGGKKEGTNGRMDGG